MRHFQKFSLVTFALVLIIIGNSALAAGKGNTIAVNLLGTATAYPSADLFDEYDVVGPDSLCWDFDLVDIKTGKSMGDVTDCAAIVGVVGGLLGEPQTGYQVIGTTFFYFPGGTVVSRVYTTVQPVTHGSPGFTHITGAVPLPGEDNVLYGDGKFKNAKGTVRFSGTGDFSTFFFDGEITIDCLFTLDFATGAK
jgi:hypothetical protein